MSSLAADSPPAQLADLGTSVTPASGFSAGLASCDPMFLRPPARVLVTPVLQDPVGAEAVYRIYGPVHRRWAGQPLSNRLAIAPAFHEQERLFE
jgi:hypothetical protein